MGISHELKMESGFKSEDAKPIANTALNLVLAICFSGLFFMIVGAAIAAALVAFGNKTFDTDVSYLLAVAFYLGLVVLALTVATYSLDGPETNTKIAVRWRTANLPSRLRRR